MLHGQCIDEPGRRIVTEGLAENGTSEALSIRGSPRLELGPHAEGEPENDPVSGRHTFGAAVDHRATTRAS